MALDLPSYLLGKSKGGGGTSDYSQLTNKPSINGVTLSGNKTSEDLGIETTQYSTMPTASADNVGKIVQYIGTTNANYTNGYFYICISDGETPATYSWENINVQAGSSGASGAVITASTYNLPETIEAVDNAFQDYLAGKPYSLFAEVHGNTSSSMLLPLYFINPSGTGFTASWSLTSPEIKTGIRSGGGEYAYYFRIDITLTNNHITGISNTIRLTSQEYGLTNDKGFYTKSENTIPYQPYNEFNIANKIYADTCGISNAYGAVIYNMNNTYVVDDVVAYYGSNNKTYKLYKCIQNAPKYYSPSSYPNYWQEITLTAKQSTLATQDYVDNAVAGAGGGSPVIINATNYQSADTLTALNTEYQKYLNGETYNIYLQYTLPAWQGGGTYTLPAYIDDQETWGSLLTNEIIEYNTTQDGANSYKSLRSAYFITNGEITSILTPELRSNQLGVGSGFMIKSGNTKSYMPSGNYNPANKLYTENINIAMANGAVKYVDTNTYTVGDLIYYLDNNSFEYYRCIQNAPEYTYPTDTDYWEPVTLTAKQSTLVTQEYVENLINTMLNQ